MLPSKIGRQSIGDQIELGAHVADSTGQPPFRLWYRFPKSTGRYIRSRGDPFLAALLIPCMALGEPLEIEAPVSSQLLSASRRLMDIYHAWWPGLKLVPVRARPARKALWPRTRRRAACFFSQGVDSYYTLLKHKENPQPGESSITHLLFVERFDVPLNNETLMQEIEKNLGLVAETTDARMLRIQTNLRQFTHRIVNWEWYHGAAMASVGLALSGLFDNIYIAASNTYLTLYPWGSHPLTDPLWSTDRLSFIHDGCEATRVQKICAIAGNELVRRTLRSCWENRGNHYNCGTCEKCLRTMIGLRIADALGKVSTFPKEISMQALSAINWDSPNIQRRFRALLGEFPDDVQFQPLAAMIERHIAAQA